jgi:hypothetical protein
LVLSFKLKAEEKESWEGNLLRRALAVTERCAGELELKSSVMVSFRIADITGQSLPILMVY